ncbi:hypothetical protein FACS1894120_5130 [Clostridia bacterium]|nr:hypothetical protein FACS1894120_5130 [Clostridia bacterium]
MATAVVGANHTVVVPALNIGERVTVFTDDELEKERERIKHNERYHAKLLRGVAMLKAGKGVEHEVDYEEDVV